ncbi:MAG: PucR family transcriptional regulator, partial [Lachnospiraceae bacterium]|nr:PucR family transcriptional regulator [Lachnospiraceae bacterium]
MLSNLVLQETINGIKNISRCELTIVTPDGKIVASTLDDAEVNRTDVISFAESQADSQEIRDVHFFKVFDDYQLEYIVLAVSDTDAILVGKMAAFQLQNLILAYKEHFDRENFIKNLLLDNLLLVDVYNRAKRLRIDTDVRRVVYILESEQSKDYSTMEAVKGLFAKSKSDFITAVDEKSIIIIKQLEKDDDMDTMVGIAESIVSRLEQGEHGSAIHVAFGNAVDEIKEVSRSYKEARMALDVGKIFFEDLGIIAFSQLGIGRLIYQLPIPLCKMFIREIFTDKSPDDFDEETLSTINKFFETSLNVSETSR